MRFRHCTFINYYKIRGSLSRGRGLVDEDGFDACCVTDLRYQMCWDRSFSDDVEAWFFRQLEVVTDSLPDTDVLSGDERCDLGENTGRAGVLGDDFDDAPVHDGCDLLEMAGRLEFLKDLGQLWMSLDGFDGGGDRATVDVKGPCHLGVR